MHNYNELVDHLVSNMTLHSTKDSYTQTGDINAPFDTQAYANYKALVDKQKDQINKDGLIESLYKLGYKIDTLLGKIISQLDTLIEEDNTKQSNSKD